MEISLREGSLSDVPKMHKMEFGVVILSDNYISLLPVATLPCVGGNRMSELDQYHKPADKEMAACSCQKK
jgi:hypothetical protein